MDINEWKAKEDAKKEEIIRKLVSRTDGAEAEKKQYTMTFPFNGVTFRQRTDIPERSYYLYPIFQVGGYGLLLAGEKGSLKTFMTYGAVNAMTKKENFGRWNASTRAVQKVPKVLIIDGEMSTRDVANRFELFDMNEYVIPYVMQDPMNLDVRDTLGVEAYREYVLEQIVEQQFDIVVLDNAFSLFVGVNHLDQKDWSIVNDWVNRLKRESVGVLMLDHFGKNKERGALGSMTKYYNFPDIIHIQINAKHKASGQNVFFGKSNVSYEHFRHGGELDDGREVIEPFMLTLPEKSTSVEQFQFTYWSEIQRVQEENIDPDEILWKALGLLIDDIKLRQMDLESKLGLKTNSQMLSKLEDANLIIRPTTKTKEVTEYGQKWYEMKRQVYELEKTVLPAAKLADIEKGIEREDGNVLDDTFSCMNKHHENHLSEEDVVGLFDEVSMG